MQAIEPAAFARRVLVLFAHPALEKSRVNRCLIEVPRALPGITFHDLYEAYPDFQIRVDVEQDLLTAHDVIVLHHPMFWYSTPALVKEWQDLVLEHGWAYGSKGTALRGKTLLSVITTGGGEDAYRHGGFNDATLRELLLPLFRTFQLCGMCCLPPFAVHGTHGMRDDEIDRHARDYGRVLEALRDGRLDLERPDADLLRLNLDLDALLGADGSAR